MLPKAWRRINNDVYLYKGSTINWHALNTGFEPFCEYFASQLLDKLGYNHVKYDLGKWKGQIVSICPLFTSKDYSYEQIVNFVLTGGIKSCAKYFYATGFTKDFSNMILFDALTMNTDRHFGNFGLLRDNHTGNIIGMAPIFDNGNSLLSLEMPESFDNKENFINIINSKEKNISYYGASYDELVAYFCTKDQIKDLNKLANFKFINHPTYKIKENRLECLTIMIQQRAKRFIKILKEQKQNFWDEQN